MVCAENGIIVEHLYAGNGPIYSSRRECLEAESCGCCRHSSSCFRLSRKTTTDDDCVLFQRGGFASLCLHLASNLSSRYSTDHPAESGWLRVSFQQVVPDSAGFQLASEVD